MRWGIIAGALEGSAICISNDIAYLKRKWNAGAVDASTGLDAARITRRLFFFFEDAEDGRLTGEERLKLQKGI